MESGQKIFGPLLYEPYLNQLGINGTNSTNIDVDMEAENYFDESPEAVLGVSTGIILMINFLFTIKAKQEVKRIKKTLVKTTEKKLKLVTILCFILSVLISPIVFTILITCSLYRILIHFILLHKFGKSFAGLLEGTDAVWAIEDTSKSVINILALIEIKEKNVDLLIKLREKMTDLISNEYCRKLSCRIDKIYGYYFWKECQIQVEHHVREMTNKKIGLEKIIGEYSNASLPNNHTTSWEILIGTENILPMQTNTIPVLFRIHHAVGDGLALLTVLLKVLADKETNFNVKKCLKNIGRKLSYNGSMKNDVRVVKISYVNKQTETETKNMLQEYKSSFITFFRNIYLIIIAPGCLLQQGLARLKDENILHGPELTGEKITTWLVEKEFPMFYAVKKIKQRFQGVTFSDVILTAVSASFCEYFEKKSRDTPEFATAVVPARIEKPEEAIQINGNVTHQNISGICHLRNRFSVAMLNLPILSSKPGNLVERLSEVKRQTELLKHSPDYKINYWLLSVISKLLPEPLLRPVLYSAHSTMVVSNVPGPRQVTICNGNMLRDLIFWLPNRGLTGIGVSILSYGEKIQLGLIVDKAIIEKTEDAQMILENISKYIKEMNDIKT